MHNEDVDYSGSVDFLTRFFEWTDHAVEIRVFPNSKGDRGGGCVFTREPQIVEAHCQKWARPGFGTFFGVATRRLGSPTGKRKDVVELPALWSEIDTEKQGLDKATCAAAVRTLLLPPSIIIDSGRGLHLYWLLKEPLAVAEEAAGAAALEEDIVAALRGLAGVCAGDTNVCDLARVMRLPGTHNTKDGGWRPVAVLPAVSSWVRYEFSDIQEMLDVQRPVVERPAPPAGDASPDNPFSAHAAAHGIKAPIDAEQRLAAMVYGADDNRAINVTQRDIAASLVVRGVEDGEILALLMAETFRVATAANVAHYWNWKREEQTILKHIATGRKKFVDSPPTRSAATVVQLRPATNTSAEPEEDAVPERPPSGKKGEKDTPLIARVGDAVITHWLATRGLIAVVDGQPYTYREGIWTAWTKADLHALKVAIQGILAAGKIDPKTALLNAVGRYVIEHPALMREDIEWDSSGFIVCQDGAIDPLSRATSAHSPDHWATARAEVRLADMTQGCPQWLAFLDSSFSDLASVERNSLLETIGEWFGAALVRKKGRELRKALWLYGESRTGKTRISEVLRLLVGEPTSSLKLRSLEKNFGPAALIGMKGWIADDAIGSADEIDDAVFKVVVTGETFSTDVKNSSHATLRLEIPVMLTSNPLPRVRDQSDAVFNRSLLIHMRVVRSEEETAGCQPIDEIVKREELAGVFSWALDGYRRLAARGRFLPPQSMLEAASEFKASNNVVGSWAKEALEASPVYMVDRRDTYASFKGWYAAEFGETAKPPSAKFVMMSLRQCMTLGPDYKQHGYPFVTGVRLTEAGLISRKESPRESGLSPGSGAPDSDVNRPRPIPAPEVPPTGPPPRERDRMPRF